MKNKFLLLIILFSFFSCKKEKTEWEIEREAKSKKDSVFNKDIPKNIIEDIFNEVNLANQDTSAFSIIGKLCAIGLNERSANDFLPLDDDLNSELLRNGYEVAPKFKDVSYLLITKYDFDTIGTYVNKDGAKEVDATVEINSLYVYNLKTKKMSFLTQHRGDEPNQIINEKYKNFANSGQSWTGVNYLYFLEKNNYLKTKKK